MQVLLNGAARDLDSVVTLADLITQLSMKPDRVAVELNRSIVPRERWAATALQEGDRLEIVHFVGGGCPSRYSSS
jgi:thiamine biosynthesis protein ThiS